MSVDAIILAAGKNERLAGLVAPYMKPLLLVNGVPLIISLIRLIEGNRIIVVAPENALQVCQVINAAGYSQRVRVVVQPVATGPVDAVWRALPYVESAEVAVLCGDNIVPERDYVDIVNTENSCLAICTSLTEDAEQAQRFTTLTKDYRFQEGATPRDLWDRSHYCCWVGPFAVSSDLLREAINNERPYHITHLSHVLDNMRKKSSHIRIRNGTCQDIGVPEALV